MAYYCPIGTGPNENQGNRLFRDVLREYKDEYRRASTRKAKKDVVSKALKEFKARGGRFVEKVVLTTITKRSPGENHYEIVEGPAVFLKARQAFRYLLRGGESDSKEEEQQTTQESTQPSSSSSNHFSPATRQQSSEADHSAPGTAQPSAGGMHMSSLSIPSRLGSTSMGTSSCNAGDLMRLTAMAVESPLLARLHTSQNVGGNWGTRDFQTPLLGITEQMFAATTNNPFLSNPSHTLAGLAMARNGNTQITPALTSSDFRVGHRGGQFPWLSGISPFASRNSLLDSSLQRLAAGRSDPLVRTTNHPVDHGIFSRIDQLVSQSLESSSCPRQQETSRAGGVPGAFSQAAQEVVLERLAIEEALFRHKQREDSAPSHLAQLLAPNLLALKTAQANPLSQQHDQMEKMRTAQALQQQDGNRLASNLLAIMASLPGDSNPFNAGLHIASQRPG